jgi:hypothetical protein
MKFAVSNELGWLGIEWNAYADKVANHFEPAAKNQCGNFRAHIPVVALRILKWSSRNERASSALKFRPQPNDAFFAVPSPLWIFHDRWGVPFSKMINGFAIHVILGTSLVRFGLDLKKNVLSRFNQNRSKKDIFRITRNRSWDNVFGRRLKILVSIGDPKPNYLTGVIFPLNCQ